MSLLFRILQLIPEVQRLEAERDALRSEQNSIKLKLRAASAEMGVLEEQLRVMQGERDRLTQETARQKAEHDGLTTQLKAATVSAEALTRERDNLALERRAWIAEEAARTERERTSQTPNNKRQRIGPG